MEDHALDWHAGVQHLEQVPGDRLALAVLVGGQVKLVGISKETLKGPNLVPFVAIDDVEGFEVVVDVDAQVGPALPFVSLGDIGGLLR